MFTQTEIEKVVKGNSRINTERMLIECTIAHEGTDTGFGSDKTIKGNHKFLFVLIEFDKLMRIEMPTLQLGR